MVNVCDRWNRDKTDDLQSAFFNGVGYESWENIWGIWNGITPRDAEAIRRIAKIERRFARLPGQPRLGAAHPDASVRRLRQQVGRATAARCGPSSIATSTTSTAASCSVPPKSGHALLRSVARRRTEARSRTDSACWPSRSKRTASARSGPGSPADADASALPGRNEGADCQAALPRSRKTWKSLPQQLVPIAPTDASRASSRRHGPNSRRPAISLFEVARHRDRRQQRHRRRRAVSVGRFAAPLPRAHDGDRAFLHRQVSGHQQQFKKFLDATHYHPDDDHNFLRDWKNGTLSRRLGQQARHLGLAGRCARLRRLGGQAAAARMGMAICGARHRRTRLSVGQRLATTCASRRRNTGRDLPRSQPTSTPSRAEPARSA